MSFNRNIEITIVLAIFKTLKTAKVTTEAHDYENKEKQYAEKRCCSCCNL